MVVLEEDGQKEASRVNREAAKYMFRESRATECIMPASWEQEAGPMPTGLERVELATL